MPRKFILLFFIDISLLLLLLLLLLLILPSQAKRSKNFPLPQPASITIGGPNDNKAYMFSATSVVARNPDNGDVVWEFNLMDEAAKYLPEYPIIENPQMCNYSALPNAIPITLPGKVIVTGALGYSV